jgi:leader peptidase (prepilin peptidase)/N-methyltransferase
VGASLLGDKFGVLKRSLVYEPGIINILSGLIPGLILLVICRISKEAVGKGDVYVVLLLGLMLGFEKTFTILFLSMTMTAVFGLGCLAVGNRKKKDSLPFIPFVLGAFAVLMITGRTVV